MFVCWGREQGWTTQQEAAAQACLGNSERQCVPSQGLGTAALSARGLGYFAYHVRF
jgi:hypothetical protein